MSPAFQSPTTDNTMPTDTNSNTSKYTLPKLASDGSNWVTYRDRMVTILAAKALMPHIRGHARQPPVPPPYIRQLPYAPPVTAASASTQTGTTTPTGQGTTGTTGTTAAATTPPTDQYSGLTDEEYEKLVERMEAKHLAWEIKEADARALIYETLTEEVFITVKNAASAKLLWEAIVTKYEDKSIMYANAIRTRLQNTRCAEGGDMHAHLTTLLSERESLAALGTQISEADFGAIITSSVPESYHGRIQSLTDMARLSNTPIPVNVLVLTLLEEYDRRAMSAQTSETALAARERDAGCFNCGRKGHIKADCWRPGGGAYGKGPRQQGANANKPPAANAATEKPREEHAFIALNNTTTFALSAPPQHYVEVYDSGATRHISPYRERFETYTELNPPRPITAANGDKWWRKALKAYRRRYPTDLDQIESNELAVWMLTYRSRRPPWTSSCLDLSCLQICEGLSGGLLQSVANLECFLNLCIR